MMNVVLVHGFLDSGKIFRPMVEFLSAAGCRCVIPTLKPSNARCGLPVLARQLADYIDSEIGPEDRFAVIGFSMGAIVSRYYLQELGGSLRATGFFSIAGPHQGTWTAYLWPGDGVSQMRPGSSLLKQLEEGGRRLEGIPVICYWTPLDLMIVPVSSTQLAGQEHVRILAPMHASLVSNGDLVRDVAERLAHIRRQLPLEPGG